MQDPEAGMTCFTRLTVRLSDCMRQEKILHRFTKKMILKTSVPKMKHLTKNLWNPLNSDLKKDLQNFLVKNLDLIEPGLELYENEGITGTEYTAGNRFADILATDSDNDLVVIELKVSKGYDRVIGQILRYMAWIEKNLADESQKVRGMIIARQISEDLKLACSKIADVELMEYELSVKIKKNKQ